MLRTVSRPAALLREKRDKETPRKDDSQGDIAPSARARHFFSLFQGSVWKITHWKGVENCPSGQYEPGKPMPNSPEYRRNLLSKNVM